jgi:hypothetical protein
MTCDVCGGELIDGPAGKAIPPRDCIKSEGCLVTIMKQARKVLNLILAEHPEIDLEKLNDDSRQ